jgi:alkaline phosphatase D
MRLRTILLAMFALSCASAEQPVAPPGDQPTQGSEAAAAPIPAPAPAPAPPPPPTRIAFGSCNDLKRPQLLWDAITQLAPSAFVWLGDIVYADTQDIAVMRQYYDELKAFPAYAALAQTTRVIGTWDDHDYGSNDAGKEYPKRVEAQQALMDFLNEPADSPRRAQAGVYTSADFGSDPYRVRVILLDTRYHRDEPGPASDVLGEEQWAWLRTQLEGSSAAVHILGSSIQVVPEQHGFEKWSNFPSARARLFALLDELAPRNLVVISGDRHFAELSKLERGQGKPPLYDLTSSSLSRPWSRPPEELNRHRVGNLVWTVNFGLIEIDWAAAEPVMHLQARSVDPAIGIDQAVPLLGMKP